MGSEMCIRDRYWDECCDGDPYLDDRRDFERLRLTCHEIYDRTFAVFSAGVLRQSWLMSEDSLDTLTAIADDDRFRARLSHLVINAHYLYLYDGVRDAARNKFLEFGRKQTDFLAGGRSTSMLAVTLSKLSKLDSVKVGQWLRQGEERVYGLSLIHI